MSTLLYGQPSLIQTFDHFLPDGYDIECTVTSAGLNAVTAMTPQSKITIALLSLTPAFSASRRFRAASGISPWIFSRPVRTSKSQEELPSRKLRDPGLWAVAVLPMKCVWSQDAVCISKTFKDASQLLPGFIASLSDKATQKLKMA